MKVQVREILWQKYRAILIAIVLFFVIDLSIMGTNFYNSYKFKESAVSINLAGRQRMLSQRTAKALLSLQVAIDNNDVRVIRQDFQELALVTDLFGTTLQGLRDGQTVTGGNGHPVFLPRVETDLSKNILEEALLIWIPYQERLRALLASQGNIDSVLLRDTISFSRKHNLRLLDLMNDLTFDLERTAEMRALRLRIVQIIGLIAALLNFTYIIGISIRKLIRRDHHLVEISEKLHNEIQTRISAEKELKAQENKLRKIASTDILTGLVNRRGFFLFMRRELKRTWREKNPNMCLAAIDLDHFKEVNDRYGHQTGDLALHHLAKMLVSHLREYDVVGRIGGDEFIVLLPATTLDNAFIILERVCRVIEQTLVQGSDNLHITISCGVIRVWLTEGLEINDIIKQSFRFADKALYEAKQQGRNRVTTLENHKGNPSIKPM